MSKSTFSWEGRPASRSRLQDFARDLTTHAETLLSRIVRLRTDINRDGWSGKTSPASCQQTKEGHLVPSSGRWQNSGMGGPTESWTLSTCEHADSEGRFPSDGDVCSLSRILETGDVPRRFYLTPKACAGILRRAERRGKQLPMMLHRALAQVAGDSSGPEKPEGKTR